MDVIVKLTVPNYIFRFYKDASQFIANSSPEDIMSDALSAYAGLLSKEVAQQQKQLIVDKTNEHL